LREATGPAATLKPTFSGAITRLVLERGFLGRRLAGMRRRQMKNFTWQLVTVLGIVVGAIVLMYVATGDEATKSRLIGYFDRIVPFVVGATTGGAVAGTMGYLRGRNLL
jgi:hypothetical protein